MSLAKLRKVGMRVVLKLSPSGKRTFVLLTASSQDRLEREAEFRHISLKLAPRPGDEGARPSAMDFRRDLRVRADQHHFAKDPVKGEKEGGRET